MLNKLKCLCIFFVVSTFSVVLADCHCKKAQEQWLFVVTADRFELEGDTLTLFKKSDDLIAFTDRPYRKQMHLTFQELAKSWDKCVGSFKDDPPNAYLTWEDTSGDQPKMMARELILFDLDLSDAQNGEYSFKVKNWRREVGTSVTASAATLLTDTASCTGCHIGSVSSVGS
jgi:hypothetical protein